MHRVPVSVPATPAPSTPPGEQTQLTERFAFIDMHRFGRTADLKRAAAASTRDVTFEDIRPQRATTLAELESCLRTSTHVLVQSHGVGGWERTSRQPWTKPQLYGGFTLDAKHADPMPHLQFVMLLACFQEYELPAWRRYAPNATIVLSEYSVHPATFSPIAVDIAADALLDSRLPTADRVDELLQQRRNRQWKIHPPRGDAG